MKSKKKVTVLIVAAFVIACAMFMVLSYGTNKKPDNLAIQGNLKVDEVNLNTKVAGNIEQVLVEEGDEVKAGTLLAVIDSSTVEAKKTQAQGALAAAQAQATKAANGARNEEVAQAKAAYEYAKKTYDRVKSLYEEGAVSGNTYDQTYAQYTAAKETYDMAMAGARSEDVSAANALVTQAQGALEEVNAYLEDCKIKAPMDGVVTSVNVSVGELVSTGMPLVAISSAAKPWVELNVKETDLSAVQVKGEVGIRLPAYPDRVFSGVVSSVSQKPDFATKRATNNNGEFDVLSYRVKVDFTELDVEVYSGMTAVVDFGKQGGR